MITFLWALFYINWRNWLTSVTAGMAPFDPEPEFTFASEPFSTADLRDTASDFSQARSDIWDISDLRDTFDLIKSIFSRQPIGDIGTLREATKKQIGKI